MRERLALTEQALEIAEIYSEIPRFFLTHAIGKGSRRAVLVVTLA